jgi:hypothetical protein
MQHRANCPKMGSGLVLVQLNAGFAHTYSAVHCDTTDMQCCRYSSSTQDSSPLHTPYWSNQPIQASINPLHVLLHTPHLIHTHSTHTAHTQHSTAQLLFPALLFSCIQAAVQWRRAARARQLLHRRSSKKLVQSTTISPSSLNKTPGSGPNQNVASFLVPVAFFMEASPP